MMSENIIMSRNMFRFGMRMWRKYDSVQVDQSNGFTDGIFFCEKNILRDRLFFFKNNFGLMFNRKIHRV